MQILGIEELENVTFIDKLTAGHLPYPYSTLLKSTQLRLYNYSATSMGWNFVMVRLLTIMFMSLGLGKKSIIVYTESKTSVFAMIGQLPKCLNTVIELLRYIENRISENCFCS